MTKKFTLPLFLSIFGMIAVYMYHTPMVKHESLPHYSYKQKMTQDRKADSRAEERARMLINHQTGKVERIDWYRAMSEINSRSNGLRTRANDLEWENNGPDFVGGRTRGFIFDKTKEGRCYTAGVSGGIFVSEDLGTTWKPIDNINDQMAVLPIGCMVQSADGDIYAGTGEYWGNYPQGLGGSQFFGNGIYKKSAGSEEWVHLASTIFDPVLDPNGNGDFDFVIDIACDPNDNNIVYAATEVGLFKSDNGGDSWDKLSSLGSNPVAQIKFNSDGQVLYSATRGKVYKSTDFGQTWEDKIGNQTQYISEGSNQHTRIAVSHQNPDKLYACGIKSNPNGDLKYVILSEDGGDTWEFLGEGDNYLNGLCNIQNGQFQCQGWYDLALKTNPADDNVIYLGGAPNIFSWSKRYGWINMTNGYSPTLGTRLVHADQHEFAFHPTHPDTMVVCTDGGNYITYNGLSGFPNNIFWKPKNVGFVVTQFYDIDANIYGELIGGTQDNGTNLTNLKGYSSDVTLEVKGGDGFDCAISAANNYKVAFATTYNGNVERTQDLSSNMKNIIVGTCASSGSGNLPGVGFHTRIDLVESIIPNEFNPDQDSVEFSFLFAYTGSGLFISPNAYDISVPTGWLQISNLSIGTLLNARGSRDLSSVYICGINGIMKSTTFRDAIFEVDTNSATPCMKATGLSINTRCSGPGLNNVSSVFVDWNDENHVIATRFGFSGNHVYESTDGINFVNKQGDLPDMPVYDCVIDPENANHVIIATEFGIWETQDISEASPKWEEQNLNIARVPTMKLVLRKFHNEGCNVLYAGTHGRGFWRVPLNDNGGCDFKIRPRPEDKGFGASVSNLSGREVAFNIYPNPATDIVKVSFSAKKPTQYYLNVYDMLGKKVKSIKYRAVMGDNIIKTNLGSLMRGNYIVRLEDENSVIGGRNMVLE